MKEEMGPDYLLLRVDVLNMQQRFKHIEKKIKSISLLVVDLVIFMVLLLHIINNK